MPGSGFDHAGASGHSRDRKGLPHGPLAHQNQSRTAAAPNVSEGAPDAQNPEYKIEITRAITTEDGSASDGALLYASQRTAANVIAERATLTIDVRDMHFVNPFDRYAWQPVTDIVQVNNCYLAPTLTSAQNHTVVNQLEVPMSCLKFGRLEGNGQPPTPGDNRVRILPRLQTAPWDGGPFCGGDVRGISIGNVYLEIQALAPVLFVHGIDSDIGAWTSLGFVNPFESAYLPHKLLHALDADGEPVRSKAGLARLNDGKIEKIGEEVKAAIDRTATEYGSTHVHVVAHSKGGLWTRHFLTDLPGEVGVLSFLTLSTPHRGSALAAAAEVSSAGWWEALASDLPLAVKLIAVLKRNPSTVDLAPHRVAHYSSFRSQKLPGYMFVGGQFTRLEYWAYLPDANLNDDRDSDGYGIIACDTNPVTDECNFDPRAVPGITLAPYLYRFMESYRDVFYRLDENGKTRVVVERDRPPVPNDFTVAVVSMVPDPKVESAFETGWQVHLKKNHHTIKEQSVGQGVRARFTVAFEKSLRNP